LGLGYRGSKHGGCGEEEDGAESDGVVEDRLCVLIMVRSTLSKRRRESLCPETYLHIASVFGVIR